MLKGELMAAATKGEIEEMSEELQTIHQSSMDEAPARRHAREAFKHIQFAIDHCLFKVMFLLYLLLLS